MGGGIAYVSAMRAGYHTLIKDISLQGISNALQYCYSRLQPQVTRRSLSAVGLRQKMSLLSGTLDYQATQAVTFVVEAVFEDLSLKQQMVAEVEAHCAETCIFASNTSSLPIRDIAAKALRPEQVVGLHYFSPADKMPLVEVIGHKFTSAQTLTRAIQLARAQGKTPIVVKDEAGFYVNRILALYLNEAARLLLQGEPIEHIDEALVTFGFPVGPLKLLDEIGLDVGAKIAPILTEHLGSRFTPPPVLALLIGDGRKGKKNRRGFYRYTRHFFQRQPRVDPSVYPLLNIQVSPRGHDAELAEPCVLSLLNEAARCLEEGIIQSARDGDIAAIFGIGFPPFLGGPFRYMDRLGASQVVNRLLVLKDKYGPQFEPCDRLKTMANTQQSFY